MENGFVGEDAVANKTAYSMKDKSACRLFPTRLITEPESYLSFEGEMVPLKFYKAEGITKGELYILGSNSQFYYFIYDQYNLKEVVSFPISQ